MSTLLTYAKSELEANYSNSDSWCIALLNDVRSVYTFTANASTDVLTTSATHDYIAGTPVQLTTTGTLPAPLATATTYYVVSPSGATLKLAATSGGSAIDITDAGTGTHTITDLAIDQTFSTIAEVIRKEVNYHELTTRPTWSPPSSATVNTSTGIVDKTAATTINAASLTTNITFNKGLLIKNGSTTAGNTTGTPTDILDFLTTQTITAGGSFTLTIPIKRQNA